MSKPHLKVSFLAGTNIPACAIPEMIALANRIQCAVEAECNGVKIMAQPGDDAIDLAIAWDAELSSKHDIKIAVAWRGTSGEARCARASTSMKARRARKEPQVHLARELGVSLGCVQYWLRHDRPPNLLSTDPKDIRRRKRSVA